MSHVMNGDKNVWPCVIGGVAAGAAIGLGLAHIARPSWCGPSKKPSNVTLSYFDGRGLAETARQMLALAGVDFEDKRYAFTIAPGDGPIFTRLQKPEFEADCAAGKFDSNLGRLPVLEVDGIKFGGSKAICRYIARTYGLNGKTSLEAARIDSICEIIGDISAAFDKESDKDQWFDTPSSVGFRQGERKLQWYLEKLEAIVGASGFAVGTGFSMADAVIYNRFGEACKTKGIFGSPDSQPMGNGAKVKELLAKCAPKVAKIVQTYADSPRIRAYLANRGPQLF